MFVFIVSIVFRRDMMIPKDSRDEGGGEKERKGTQSNKSTTSTTPPFEPREGREKKGWENVGRRGEWEWEHEGGRA